MKWIYFIFGLIAGVVFMQCFRKIRKYNKNVGFVTESAILKLAESSKDIIYYYQVHPDYGHKYMSPSVECFLGEGMQQRLFTEPYLIFERIHPKDYDILLSKLNGTIDYSKAIKQRIRDNDGNYKWFEEHATPVYENGELIAVQGILRNIDEKVQLEQELNYKLYHDSLTNIYNRDFFEKLMDTYNTIENTSIAIILCDLDDLKMINDTKGHKSGDHLIQEAAKVLDQFSTDCLFVSRIGGDEFAIIMPNVDQNQVEDLCTRIVEQLHYYNDSQPSFKLRMSMGFAHSQQSVGEMDRLFVEADGKMYEQKRNRKQSNDRLLSFD
ncbi:sensor domain-containing diguanylate cyclase [Solibacillus sp. FSL R7-0682]|uniref:sensor domain-containing diguanylate cyclase n=1 Tax=Solibacillus sp. FSL R7-0682 TaxID=2921690 RepID=UPI0030FA6204